MDCFHTQRTPTEDSPNQNCRITKGPTVQVGPCLGFLGYQDLLDLRDTKESRVMAVTTRVWPSESQITSNLKDCCEMWVLSLWSMVFQDPRALQVLQDTPAG